MIFLFIKNILKFSIWLLCIPIIIEITDPLDYYANSPFRLKYDRIHSMRKTNVADWALSEIHKIKDTSKEKVTTISIGDSRGRMLISGGYEGGWKTRLIGNNNSIYDLSFGGAQLNESFSLLKLEAVHCPNVNAIILCLPVDRLLEKEHERNRIEKSVFNSYIPDIRYLTNIDKIKLCLDNYKNISRADENTDQANETKEISKEKQKVIEGNFLSVYKNANHELFDKNIADLKIKIEDLKKEYQITIIIPPYQPSFFKTILSFYQKDYIYYLTKIKELPVTIYDLNEKSDEFYFYDPVHGIPKHGYILDMIKTGSTKY